MDTAEDQVLTVRVKDLRPTRLRVKVPVDLQMSIDEKGVEEPIVVRPTVSMAGHSVGFEILEGFKRVAACRNLGITHVQAVIRANDRLA